jgi:hypothetical protein
MFIPGLAHIRCGIGATARLVRATQANIVHTFDGHEFGEWTCVYRKNQTLT